MRMQGRPPIGPLKTEVRRNSEPYSIDRVVVDDDSYGSGKSLEENYTTVDMMLFRLEENVDVMVSGEQRTVSLGGFILEDAVEETDRLSYGSGRYEIVVKDPIREGELYELELATVIESNL